MYIYIYVEREREREIYIQSTHTHTHAYLCRYTFSWLFRNFGDGCAMYWRWSRFIGHPKVSTLDALEFRVSGLVWSGKISHVLGTAAPCTGGGAYIHTRMHTILCIRIYIYICIYLCIYLCIAIHNYTLSLSLSVYIYIYIWFTYIYIYIYIYIHTTIHLSLGCAMYWRWSRFINGGAVISTLFSSNRRRPVDKPQIHRL